MIKTVYQTDIKAFSNKNYGFPIVLVSKNITVLHDIEIFDAATKLMDVKGLSYPFTNGFGNLTYKHILAEIAYGNGFKLGAIRINDNDSFSDNVEGPEKKIVIENRSIYGSSTRMPFIIFPEPEYDRDRDYKQSYIVELEDSGVSALITEIKSSIGYNILNRFTSIKINRLAPNTALYFYPIISQ